MKKILGIMAAMVMMGVVLAGCYPHTCEQPEPMNLKGEG